jgi:hypothetical protein
MGDLASIEKRLRQRPSRFAMSSIVHLCLSQQVDCFFKIPKS